MTSLEAPDGDAPVFPTPAEAALLVDHYELTMLQAYRAEGMHARAHFSLFVRRLPPGRNFLLACGLGTVLELLENYHFPAAAIAHLRGTGDFDGGFLDWLGGLRFTGDVRAVPEGTPIFAEEPILEVEAPLPEAQVIETLVMNQLHLQTVLASKAARVRAAAGHRTVVDFGVRRMHGADAGLKSARAFHVAGLDATSNVLAGKVFGVPVTGTMAHAYIQAHDDEMESFRAWVRTFPETVLLVDTYDTLEGVRKVVRLAGELGENFRVRGIRLDSGDLGALATESRKLLDEGGLSAVAIFASGGLDEWKIRELVRAGAPIDGFGVGTAMGVSKDAPSLDMVYKLTSHGGQGRLKLSSGKRTLPGRKQVFREEDGEGKAVRDTIGRDGESLPGRPLLRPVMQGGRRLPEGREPLEELRRRASREVARLPARVRALEDADPPFEVGVSEELQRFSEAVARQVAETAATTENA
jgi:nicotinate phosphoribosyltransferase